MNEEAARLSGAHEPSGQGSRMRALSGVKMLVGVG